jgi:hypothetical protein
MTFKRIILALLLPILTIFAIYMEINASTQSDQSNEMFSESTDSYDLYVSSTSDGYLEVLVLN